MTERNVSVTLKAGKGYDAPWLTFTGDNAEETKRNVAEAVNLDFEIADQYSLAEVTIFASESFQGTSNVVVGLGAEPVELVSEATAEDSGQKGSESGWTKAKAKRSGGGSGTAPSGKDEKAPESNEDPILVAIGQATSDKALRAVYARHKAAWNEDYTAAVAARKEELG